MLQHLADESGGAREADSQVETPEALWCTKTGCVTDLKGSRSIFDLNRAYSRELDAKRTAPPTREQGNSNARTCPVSITRSRR